MFSVQDAHLVPDACPKVPQESAGLALLYLPELHRRPTQEIVQLYGEDGCRPALILRALIPCRTETFSVHLGHFLISFRSLISLL